MEGYIQGTGMSSFLTDKVAYVVYVHIQLVGAQYIINDHAITHCAVALFQSYYMHGENWCR